MNIYNICICVTLYVTLYTPANDDTFLVETNQD